MCNMFKVNNKDTRTTPHFEHVNADCVCTPFQNYLGNNSEVRAQGKLFKKACG